MKSNTWLFIAILLSSVCTYLFLMPSNGIKSNVDHADKIVHFGLFFTLTILWFLTKKQIGHISIALVFYGILMEICQYLLPAHFHRGFDLWDIIADSLGVLAAYILIKIFNRS